MKRARAAQRIPGGIGLDLPFTEAFHGTVESYGAENSSPDRAVGLRYELRGWPEVFGCDRPWQ